MALRTIAQHWAAFERLVLPADCGPVQRQEMRRAFYCGAHAVLTITLEISSAEVSEDAGAAILEGLHDECRRFATDVQERRA
jgi:hypothetical protein